MILAYLQKNSHKNSLNCSFKNALVSISMSVIFSLNYRKTILLKTTKFQNVRFIEKVYLKGKKYCFYHPLCNILNPIHVNSLIQRLDERFCSESSAYRLHNVLNYLSTGKIVRIKRKLCLKYFYKSCSSILN